MPPDGGILVLPECFVSTHTLYNKKSNIARNRVFPNILRLICFPPIPHIYPLYTYNQYKTTNNYCGMAAEIYSPHMRRFIFFSYVELS